jgi:hypothetical protein
MQMNSRARREIAECIRQLASIEFQERVWVRGDGPEVSSFDELVCQLFDDTGLGEVLLAGRGAATFGVDADLELRRLSDMLDRVPAGLDAGSLLRHPIWPEVLVVARRAAALLPDSAAAC